MNIEMIECTTWTKYLHDWMNLNEISSFWWLKIIQILGLGLFTKSTGNICFVQGPKFVSDEEIERIKAKIEEDNRAIAALESKKYGEKREILITVLWHAGGRHMTSFVLKNIFTKIFYLDSFVPPRSTTITRYDSPSHTINSELRSEVNKSQRDILERPHDGAVLVLIIFIKG